MSLLFDHRQYQVISHLSQPLSQRLLNAVLDDTLVPEKVFRDNWRTLSARVYFQDESLLLKVPRARNGRRWERFLTLFRESDALRTFRHLDQMATMGFAAPTPILACERRHHGVVVDCFVCYHFVDGRTAQSDDAPRVLTALQSLHRRGYLRNDAQLANFLITDGAVFFIDFRLKKPRFLPQLQKARELDRFLRSCPEARQLMPRGEVSSLWLRVASLLENASFGFRAVKKRMRGRTKRRGNTRPE